MDGKKILQNLNLKDINFKKIGRAAFNLLLATILAACGASKPAEVEGIDFLDCEKEETATMDMDVPVNSTVTVEGASVKVKDANGNLNVKGSPDVSTDGTITFHRKGQDLLIKGSPGKDGKSHIDFKAICVHPAVPTPTTTFRGSFRGGTDSKQAIRPKSFNRLA